VDQAGAAPETMKPPRGGVRRWAGDHPTAVAAIAYGLTAVAAGLAAFYALFTQFASYDDEGTLLVALRAFADGQVLYRDIYAAYGPFFFEVFGGFFALTGWAVTNDASRLIVGLVWVASSVLFGVAAQRLTGRLALGIAATVVAFSALRVLAAEPMHPQVAIAPLMGGITLLVASGPGRRVALSGALVGALLAGLVLTKANVGGYAVLAAVFAAALAWEPLRSRPWLRLAAIAVLLLLPFLIMYPDLGEEWVHELAVLELFALAAIAIAAHTARPLPRESDQSLRRWLLAVVAGAIAAGAAVLGILLLTGTTPAETFDGIITQGLKLREAFMIALTSPRAAVAGGILAVACAGLGIWLRGGRPRTSIYPGALRVAAGLTIWFTVTGSAPLSLNPTGNPIVLPMALAWVAAFAPAGSEEAPFARFARIFLPLFAVTQTLQVYPVAGSQIRISAVAFVAVGAICITDGTRQLRAWGAANGWEGPRLQAVSSAAAFAVVAVLAFPSVISSAASDLVAYRERPALPYAGADLLHLAAREREELIQLVDLLHENHCTTFIGFPNVDSLYLFSGIEPPKPNSPGAWPIVLPLDQQQRVVDQMKASPRPCAIRNDGLADRSWLHGTPPDESDPLIGYIFNDFETVATVGEFEFQLPK
jgi:hypothetical protein